MLPDAEHRTAPLGLVKTPVSVSQLTARIKKTIESEIGYAHVFGETSNVHHSQAGHIYLTLKDEKAQLTVAIFHNVARSIKFKIENGMELILSGRITVYEARGNYQMIAERVEPRGIGALQLAFDQLKAKLEKEGLFDKSRKKPLPFLPRRIAIATSPSGAALRDMLNVLTKRFPPLHITIFPVRVQGEGAAEEIAGAVAEINLIQDVDVIIVGRGGGSIEDLWAFNEEVLARAIAASRTPVISAVGHETDLTISDLVADLRALTPTEAAERVVPDLADLLGSLESNGGRLRYSMESMISVLDARLHKHRDSHALKSPETIADQYLQRLRHLADGLTLRLQERHQGALAGIEALAQTLHFRLQGRFDQTASRLAELTAHMSLRPILSTFRNGDDRIHRLSPQLDTLARHRLDRSERELKQLSALLESFSPLQVLGRGYTITFNAASGKIVKDGSELKHGDLLKTRFHTGETISRVEKE